MNVASDSASGSDGGGNSAADDSGSKGKDEPEDRTSAWQQTCVSR